MWNHYYQLQHQPFVRNEEEEEEEEEDGEENRDEGSVGEDSTQENHFEEGEEGDEGDEGDEGNEGEEEEEYMGDDGQLVLSEEAIEFFAQSEMRRQEREDHLSFFFFFCSLPLLIFSVAV